MSVGYVGMGVKVCDGSVCGVRRGVWVWSLEGVSMASLKYDCM